MTPSQLPAHWRTSDRFRMPQAREILSDRSDCEIDVIINTAKSAYGNAWFDQLKECESAHIPGDCAICSLGF